MSILLPALAVAFAALCVWLAVRIFNRRERWAKWTAFGLIVGLPVLYLLSFGPACWWYSSKNDPGWPRYGDVVTLTSIDYRYAPQMYWPIGWAAKNGPALLNRAICWYATLGIEKVFLPSDSAGTNWFGA